VPQPADRRWPFEDPPNTACFTTVGVLWHGVPVGLVTHDEDDGAFQFLPFGGAANRDDPDECRLVGLGEMLSQDPTLAEVADLPLGWCAMREAPGQPWRREPLAPDE